MASPFTFGWPSGAGAEQPPTHVLSSAGRPDAGALVIRRYSLFFAFLACLLLTACASAGERPSTSSGTGAGTAPAERPVNESGSVGWNDLDQDLHESAEDDEPAPSRAERETGRTTCYSAGSCQTQFEGGGNSSSACYNGSCSSRYSDGSSSNTLCRNGSCRTTYSDGSTSDTLCRNGSCRNTYSDGSTSDSLCTSVSCTTRDNP